jgi:hypothetical protein
VPALQNRQEWETRGEAIVVSMTKQVEASAIKEWPKLPRRRQSALDTRPEKSGVKRLSPWSLGICKSA